MNNAEAKTILETALLCASAPLSMAQIERLYPASHDMASSGNLNMIADMLAELQADWAGKGIELVQVATGWRFQARAAMQVSLESLSAEKPPRYSRAALETLAIIAYRQPVTRGDIEQIRGVAVNAQIIRSLEERGWVEEVGVREVPGRPALLATTAQFLEDLGLERLSQLPPLKNLDIAELPENILGALPEDQAVERSKCSENDALAPSGNAVSGSESPASCSDSRPAEFIASDRMTNIEARPPHHE